MKNICTFAFLILVTSSTIFSQNNLGVLFSMQQLPDGSWGVFMKPDNGLVPSGKLMTGTGQITIVATEVFEYMDFKNYGGTWGENARIESPMEAEGYTYVSFGLLNDMPRIQMLPQEETLLFSFVSDRVYDGTFYLFDNNYDPFMAPNSESTNPGNEIAIADIGNGGVQYYRYTGNYSSESNTQAVFAKYERNATDKPIEVMAIQWIDDEENEEKE